MEISKTFRYLDFLDKYKSDYQGEYHNIFAYDNLTAPHAYYSVSVLCSEMV